MINLTDLECKHCGRGVAAEGLSGWVVSATMDNAKDAICPECLLIHGAAVGSIQLSGEMSPVFELAAPLTGRFKPVKNEEQIKHFRDAGSLGDSWWELEMQNLDSLNYKYPLLKVTIKNRDFQELWIGLDRENGEVVSLRVSGDRPSKNQFMTVHQQFRLRSMGLTESTSKNTDWKIELSPAERSNENVARIMSHILQFGLFVQPHKNFGMTAIVDK